MLTSQQTIQKFQREYAQQTLESLIALARKGGFPGITYGGYGIVGPGSGNEDGTYFEIPNEKGQDFKIEIKIVARLFFGASYIRLIVKNEGDERKTTITIPAGLFSGMPWSLSNRLCRNLTRAYHRSPQRIEEQRAKLFQNLSSANRYADLPDHPQSVRRSLNAQSC